MESVNYLMPLIFWLLFYTLFTILYVAYQKLSKKEIKLKTIRNGGAISTIAPLIIVSVLEEPPPDGSIPFFILWGLVIFGLIKYFEDKKGVSTSLGKGYENAILFGVGIGLSPLVGLFLLSRGIYHEIAIFPILISATTGLFLLRRQFTISAIIGTLLILILFRTGLLGYIAIDVNPIVLLVILVLPGLISEISAEKIRRKEFQWNLLYIILGFLPVYVFAFNYFGGYSLFSIATILLILITGSIGAYYKTEKSPVEERPKEVEKKEEEKPTIEPVAPKPEPPVEKIVEEIKKEPVPPKPTVQQEPQKGGDVYRNCPSCGGKISKLNYYKLKAGESAECDYCEDMIYI